MTTPKACSFRLVNEILASMFVLHFPHVCIELKLNFLEAGLVIEHRRPDIVVLDKHEKICVILSI